MKKKITLTIAVVFVVLITFINLHAQETAVIRSVSGTVTYDSGEPVMGANVMVKGTHSGTVSGADGKYSIDVPGNAVLLFLFVGCIEQEIAVNNRQIIDITLEDEFSRGLQPAQPVKLTAKQKEIAAADNRFAFKMFKKVSEQEGDNTFFSPLSFNMALGMLYNGASGENRNEIAEARGITEFSETEVNEYYQNISQALKGIDPTADIAVANSIWYRNGFSVKKEFVETGKDYFDAEVRSLDFNVPNAAGTINDWCAEKTNGRIKDLIAGPINSDMMMYLINALYFKSQWQADIKFDKKKTKTDKFTKTDRQKIKVNLMEQTSYFNYFSDDNLECVEMDYGNRAFSMVAVLPSNNRNIDQLISYLDSENLHDAIKNMRWQKVWLKLPRFKAESDFSLYQPVKDLGMEQMFKGGFKNISDDDLWVSDILQKTFVEVNEEGTEAAAATTIIMVGASGRQKKIKPVRFFADRPFLYLIREKSTGAILFIGRMDEPVE